MQRKTKTKLPGKYHQHRERQRRRILDAATRLFDEQGIDRTTMAELIAASGVQASTLYEYFSKKDEIVWAILSETLTQDAESIKARVDSATTGLSRITALLQHMADQLTQHQDKIRFMAQFDAMYARHWPVERLLTVEGQLDNHGFEALGALIREGIADGSLRSDLDPELTLHAVLNAMIGAQRRLASLGAKVETEYGHSITRLFQETIRIVLLGLSAPPPSTRTKPSPRAARTGTKRKRTT